VAPELAVRVHLAKAILAALVLVVLLLITVEAEVEARGLLD
jgi:hypothetical protein